jgi:hypothetical protein
MKALRINGSDQWERRNFKISVIGVFARDHHRMHVNVDVNVKCEMA